MAGPITWRTIMGPQPAEAARPLALAQQSFDNMFGRLNSVLDERQKIDAQNWEQGKQNNTNAALNQLYGLDSAAAFQDAQRAGVLQQLLTGNGAQIDQAALRNAIDGRLATLQDREKRAVEFNNFKLDQEQAPVVQQIIGLAAQGKAKEAAAVLGANPALRNAGAMYKAITEGERDLTRFKWDGEKHTSNMLTDDVQRSTSRAQAQAALANAAAANANAATASQRLQMDKEQYQSAKDAAAAAAEREAVMATNMFKDGMYTPDRAPEIMEMLVKNKIGDDDDDRRKIVKRLDGLATSMKIKIGDREIAPGAIPLAAVKASILGSDDQIVNSWGQGWANEMENNLRSQLEQTYTRRDVNGNPVNDSVFARDLQVYLEQAAKRAASPVLTKPKR